MDFYNSDVCHLSAQKILDSFDDFIHQKLQLKYSYRGETQKIPDECKNVDGSAFTSVEEALDKFRFGPHHYDGRTLKVSIVM